MSLFDDDVIFDDDDLEASSAPALQGLVEPKSMDFCLGHDDQERLFIEMYQNDCMPHAVIFSGAQGIGKTTMAFRLARFLLKNAKDANQDSLFGGDSIPAEITSLDVAQDDPVFSRVASGGHADLLHIYRAFDDAKGKQDATLKVESLRKIEPFLRKTASEGGWRIVIVEDADTMNRSAQNAILKILEEPPAQVMIILVAHRPGLLIPTIRSRARVMPFSVLEPDTMRDLLARQGHVLAAHDLESVTALSGGSIGQAIRYIEQGGLDMLKTVLDMLDAYPQWNWRKIHELSSSLSSAAQDKDYRLFTDIMQWVFRQMLFIKARGSNDLPQYLKTDTLQGMMEQCSLEKLIEISDGLKDHFNRIDFSNLDRRDAVRAAFLVIHQ